MGYDSSDNWHTKADVVNERVRDYQRDSTYELVEYKSTREGLWSIQRHRTTGKLGIVFDLIEKERGRYYVKNMDESMGPYYYSCPQKFLRVACESKSFNYNAKWRAQWVNANANKKAKAPLGGAERTLLTEALLDLRNVKPTEDVALRETFGNVADVIADILREEN